LFRIEEKYDRARKRPYKISLAAKTLGITNLLHCTYAWKNINGNSSHKRLYKISTTRYEIQKGPCRKKKNYELLTSDSAQV
jgi:hypothetical protein